MRIYHDSMFSFVYVQNVDLPRWHDLICIFGFCGEPTDSLIVEHCSAVCVTIPCHQQWSACCDLQFVWRSLVISNEVLVVICSLCDHPLSSAMKCLLWSAVCVTIPCHQQWSACCDLQFVWPSLVINNEVLVVICSLCDHPLSSAMKCLLWSAVCVTIPCHQQWSACCDLQFVWPSLVLVVLIIRMNERNVAQW